MCAAPRAKSFSRVPELLRHPDTPSRAVQAVTAEATRTAEGKLALSYVLRGDIRALRIPPPGPARIGWKLWRHTCCEVFLREKGAEPSEPRVALALGLSVVIEEESGALSYWALRHAPGKPDFHHASAFALELR